MLLPLYLRKETNAEGRPVVAYYTDSETTNCKAFNPWSGRPTRRNKYVMLNCYRWRAVWLPDAA